MAQLQLQLHRPDVRVLVRHGCAAAGMRVSCGAGHGREREFEVTRLGVCGNSNWQARGIGQRHCACEATRQLALQPPSPLRPASYRAHVPAHPRRRLR